MPSTRITEQTRLYRRRLGVILFSIGVLLGMVLLGGAVYADFESTLFDVSIVADGSIRPIQCPIVLNDFETGVVTASISNNTSQTSERLVRAHISKGHLILIREIEERVVLAPGETRTLRWTVSARDAAYGHLILVKVIALDDGIQPSHKGSCGVIVLDLPYWISGQLATSSAFALSLGLLLSGAGLWWTYGRSYTGRRLEATRAIFLLGIIIVSGLTFVFLGFWEFAAAAFYLAVLALGVITPHFLVFRQN